MTDKETLERYKMALEAIVATYRMDGTTKYNLAVIAAEALKK